MFSLGVLRRQAAPAGPLPAAEAGRAGRPRPAGVTGVSPAIGRRSELLAFLPLAVVQIAVAWMLPRAAHAEYYLLGATLVLLASGCLLGSRPRSTGALVVTTGLAVSVAVVTAPTPMRVEDVVGAAVCLATASLIATVAHVRRHALDVRGVLTRLSLETEQEHGRALLSRLERLGTEDSLTGLANRRQWDDALGAACAHARETGGSVAVILVDLDHFACVNDRHGHPGGDEVLRQVATLFTDTVRGGDLVARLGGDELAVLLPGARAEHATLLAERLRAGVEMLLLPGFWIGEITASLGVAVAAGAQAFPVELMSRADQQLFCAKITRNSVGAPDDPLRVPEPRRPLRAPRPVA